MPPIWLCLDCEDVAYGWAPGRPCIYCHSLHVVGTDDAYAREGNSTGYRLVFLPVKQWEQLEAEAHRANRSPRDLLAERAHAPIVLQLDEPVQGGRLILFDTRLQGRAVMVNNMISGSIQRIHPN